MKTPYDINMQLWRSRIKLVMTLIADILLLAAATSTVGTACAAEDVPLTYQVRAIAPQNGSLGATPVLRTIAAGGSAIFNFNFNIGYKLDVWLVNNVVAQYGGASYTLTNINADAVVTATTYFIYKTPVISPITISSRNSNPAWAKQGDTVTLSFSTNFPNQTPSVTLLGWGATVEKLVGNNWIARDVVVPGMQEGPATFFLSSMSEVGISSLTASGTTNGSTVTVDRTAPVLALSGNITLEAANASGKVFAYTANTTDTLDPAPSLNTAPPSGSIFGLGMTTVNASSTDAAGNTATGSFMVTVRDTTAPVVAPYADVTVVATSALGAVVSYSATATDAVSTPTITYSLPSGSIFPIGITTVTITAKDNAGNKGYGTFSVTVTNNQPVVTLTGANPLTFEAAATYTDLGARADDVEDGPLPPVITGNSVVANVPGSYAVTWSATDARNSSGSATRVVKVVDTTAPVVALHDDVTVEAPSPSGAVVDYAAGSATDAVGVISLTYSKASGETFPLGETIVTITAKDAANKEGTSTFTVKVVDTTAPVVASHANVTKEATSAAGAVVSYAPGSATDAVGVTSLTYSPESGTLFPMGTTTVTITAKDAAGKTGSGTFVVTVQDTTPPVISSVTSAGLFAIGTPATVTASFSDEVAVGSITFNWGDGLPNTVLTNPASPITASHSYSAAGVYLITVTVADGKGNSFSETFRYMVISDPDAGFVTGGGWFNSPPGAYVPNAAVAGKANFGFNAKYKKESTVPSGDLQFQVGSLKFDSTSSEWLVVSGSKVQYKGIGTINGTGRYGFLLTASDGKKAGGGGADRFRIKIWDKSSPNSPVYDNAPGFDDLSGSPTQPIAGGSIVIHK